MSALFPSWTNTFARLSLIALAAVAAGVPAALLLWVRSPLFRQQHDPLTQPVEFDHRHHVADNGIDCRFCHESVETAGSAGFPPTATCMACHAQIWNRSP